MAIQNQCMEAYSWGSVVEAVSAVSLDYKTTPQGVEEGKQTPYTLT